MRKISATGVFLILIGVLWYLKIFGVITVSLWQSFWLWWPIGLILVGIAMMLRQGRLASMLLIVLIVLGVIFLVKDKAVSGSERTLYFEESLSKDSVTLDLQYGGGEISVIDGDRGVAFSNTVKTRDSKSPSFQVIEGDGQDIRMARTGSVGFLKEDSWKIELSPDAVYDINLDYGAAKADMDLSNLKVSSIDIGSGASELEVKFADYPTSFSLSTGASSVRLHFPKGSSVSIETSSGLTSHDLDGFVKDGKMYYSEGFSEKNEKIEVKISSGVSSIEADFY